MKREFFLILIVTIFSFYLISSHTITPVSFSVNPNESYTYNITINNTDTGPDANVTQVNITLPGSFVFIENSNGTNTFPENFMNESNILSWTNDSNYLIQESESKEFWFNASASTFGDYNLTIIVVNLTRNFEYNISVTIEDTRDPSVSFGSSTPNNNAILNQTNILLSVSATDKIATDTITGYIYNSTRNLLSSSKSTNNSLIVNFTVLTDGDYFINATVNDTSGNTDSTLTRKITINTSMSSSVGCTENWNCTAWSECSNNLQIRSCIDSNACNSSQLTKNENQTCGSTCTPNWDCTDWNPEKCTLEETQTRTCTDLNNCGLTKPVETLNCSEEEGSKFLLITILSIVVGILFLIGVIFFLKGRGSEEPSIYSSKKSTPPSGRSSSNLSNYSRRPRMFSGMSPKIPRLPRRPTMRNFKGMMRRPPQKRGNFQNKPL